MQIHLWAGWGEIKKAGLPSPALINFIHTKIHNGKKYNAKIRKLVETSKELGKNKKKQAEINLTCL